MLGDEDPRSERVFVVAGLHRDPRCAMIGPPSTGPSVTKCTVAPLSVTPRSSAWRCGRSPGKAGSRLG